jgi:hypothetical protein
MIYFKLCLCKIFLRQCLEDLLLGSLQMKQVKTEKWKEKEKNRNRNRKRKKEERKKIFCFLVIILKAQFILKVTSLQ